MGFWSGLCTCIGCVAAVGVCVLSAGTATPFVSAAAAPWLIGGGTATGFLIGSAADKESEEREKRLEQNQRYKDAKDEVNQQIKINDQTRTQILDITGKINGTIPREPNETDDYLNTQFAILTGNLRSGEDRLADLRKTMDAIRKELGGGNSLMSFLGLNKLGKMDKLMIIAVIILVIWLLKG